MDGTCLSEGFVLRGPRHSFTLERVLGKGGFGITYRGRENASGMAVAVKEYFPQRCNPCRQEDGSILPTWESAAIFEKGKKSFLNEAAMLKALEDIPSAVKVLDFFDQGGTAYMVMEFLGGTTLRSLVEKSGSIPANDLMPRLLPLIRDISAMHQRGVLHRDIAPDNIMWMPNGTLKLLDFGCARAMEDGKSMTVMLKPGFAPFEQYQTKGQGDYTDLYALCATIYYCLTGLVPPSAPERVFAITDGNPDPLPWPRSSGIQMSPELEAMLMWGLGALPSQRPQTVEQWLERVEPILPPLPPVPKKRFQKLLSMGSNLPSLWKHAWKVLRWVVYFLVFLIFYAIAQEIFG